MATDPWERDEQEETRKNAAFVQRLSALLEKLKEEADAEFLRLITPVDDVRKKEEWWDAPDVLELCFASEVIERAALDVGLLDLSCLAGALKNAEDRVYEQGQRNQEENWAAMDRELKEAKLARKAHCPNKKR